MGSAQERYSTKILAVDAGGHDGRDLVVLNNGSSNQLYSSGLGMRADISDGNGNENADTADGVAVDFDGDGWRDLYIVNDGQPNELHLFTGIENSAFPGGIEPEYTDFSSLGGDATDQTISGGRARGVVALDCNMDGNMDLFVVNYEEPNQLFIRSATFAESAMGATPSFTEHMKGATNPPAILADPSPSHGALAFDADGDGIEDILVLNGISARNELWINDGSCNFELHDNFKDLQQGEQLEYYSYPDSRGALALNADGDGHQDIFVLNYGGRSELFLK